MRRKWRTPSDSEPEGREWANGVPEEANLQWVKVNGIEAELYGDYWVAVGVPLNAEGNDEILVEARDAGIGGVVGLPNGRGTARPRSAGRFHCSNLA